MERDVKSDDVFLIILRIKEHICIFDEADIIRREKLIQESNR